MELFKNRKEILLYLYSKKQYVEVRELLFLYKKSYSDNKFGSRIFPVYVLEGLDGTGKTSMSYRIASEHKFIRWSSPSKTIKHLKGFFNAQEDKQLRLAFYLLGNYIAMNEIAVMRKKKPVIVDRFFHSTCASYYANLRECEYSEEILRWPKDLMKPTCIFFLNIPEEIRAKICKSKTLKQTEEEIKLLSDPVFRNNFINLFLKIKCKNFYEVENEKQIVDIISACT
nr:MAG: UMP-CMP kinase 2-like protein [Diabrotica toursvirus 3a]